MTTSHRRPGLDARPPTRPRRVATCTRFATAGTLAVAVAAVAGVIVAPTASAAPAPPVEVHRWAAAMTDLQPGVAGPLDSAKARLVLISANGSTTAVLALTGVGTDAVGHTYGAHLHTGPCIAGNGAAAGPHYNDSTMRGAVPPVVGPTTEVWLDITIGPTGSAVAVARVPFVPQPGDRSVVVHAQATDEHGTAGARLACLPVTWT